MNDSNRSFDRRTILKMAGVAGAAGLAGCSGNQGSGTQTGSGMADTVKAWSWDVAAESLDETDDPYEEGKDGVDVVVEQFGRSDMKDKYKSRLVSGSGAPAVATMESVDAAAWVDTGGLRDIGAWIEDSGEKDNFASGKWGPLEKDGGTYALPWDIGPVGLFYRQDVWDEHGLSPDNIETYDDFIAEGDKLPDDVALANLPPNDYDGVWRMLFRMQGGVPFTSDGKVAINSEESLIVARTMKQLADSGVAASVTSWSSDWFNRFGNGTISSLLGGAWMEGTLKAELGDTAGNWRVLQPPALESGGNRATNWGGSNLVIADQVSDPKAQRAWDYMKFTLATVDMQVKMYQSYGIFPAYKPAYQSDAFDEGSDFLGGQAAGRLFADMVPDIPDYVYTTDTPAVTEAINATFGEMINGNLTPQEAVDQAAQQVADQTDREVA
jgi:multiple sugar transport system substrate-binding protein/lactose/L-arabinose transport system substrate-binding protein